MSGFQIKLPIFEGPFDLLYHLIEEQKYDINDIPIAQITNQYLEYLQMMEILDMDIASPFLVMAATLIETKSKMILLRERPPVIEMPTGDEIIDEGFYEEEDPRAKLVEQLREYKTFKDLARKFREMERNASRIYTRSYDIEHRPEEVLEINIGPIELLDIYHALIRRRLSPPIHRVVLGKLSIIDRINEIRTALKNFKKGVTFARLVGKDATRYDKVISFMAILEMTKAGEIHFEQTGNFEPIDIFVGREAHDIDSNDDELEIPDDASKMPMAKPMSKGDEDIKAIKVKDIPEELLNFKTPSQLAEEARLAALAAMAAQEEQQQPVTGDLSMEGTSALDETVETPESVDTPQIAENEEQNG